ncbi:LysR family transcriptional regulator [Shimia sp.]|uniref:LysR family transcriptional regulator n=1 Tax=Shimia sp. TaxID=1954381 RepID=UPI003B8E9536
MANVRTINWDDLRILSAVSETKSLTGAAKVLNVDPATVSRRMARLSQALGKPVYSKQVDGWRANPELDSFFEVIERFNLELSNVVNQLTSLDSTPSGQISVEAPACVVSGVFLPNFENLTSSAPELNVTLHRSLASTGLGQNDLIVTSVQPEHGRLMTQAIGQMTLEAFAPKDADLKRQKNWIAGSEAEGPFSVTDLGTSIFGCPPTHHLDTFADALRMMFANGGACVLPRALARDHASKLSRVDPSRTKHVPLYLCFHESRKSDPTVRAVADWIKETFKAESALCRNVFPDLE